MARVDLAEILSGYLSAEALNAALADIQTALDRALFRDGEAPNAMEADLDMGGFTILNTSSDPDIPGSVPTWGDLTDFLEANSSGYVAQQVEVQTATASQEVFNLTTLSYVAGSNNLAVYVNGLRKFSPTDYTETDSDTVTFNVGLSASDEVVFVTNDYLATVSFPTHTHTWSQIIGGVPEYATRWPSYAEVTDKPSTFTPAAHNHAASEITSGRVADARRGVYVQASQPSSPTVGDLWFF